MKTIILTCSLCLVLVTPLLAEHTASQQDSQPHGQSSDQPGNESIGKPGDESEISRNIEVSIKETASGEMLFQPEAIHIVKGSVVRFVIVNSGALEHEFFLGSFAEIEEHRQWSHKHPDSEHKSVNAIRVSVGETAELIWEFSYATNLEFACLIPGHREAGMYGIIMVHDHSAPGSDG